MKLDNAQLKEILLSGNYITKEDLDKAEEYTKSRKGSLVDYLITEGFLTKDLLGQAIAEAHNIAYADLNSNVPSREQVLRIPEETGKSFRVVLFAEDEKTATVTTDAPKVQGLMEALTQIIPSKKIVLAYSLSEDIDAAFIHYRRPLETRFSKILEKSGRAAPELISEIIEDALAFRASDIHFEPTEKDFAIRFRIDGVLHEAGRFTRRLYENILNRIKVQARLRIDEHFSSQDGSIRYQSKDRLVDLRVSVVPTIKGEKIVIRILAHYVQGFNMGDIGLSPDNQDTLEKSSKRPFGMILMTGPTGSGKTTTLYAALRLLNRPEVNITTIEDPVEYRIDGVNQIQVNQQTNLTFAKGLRSIVRQDPDVILVGEIRDVETAEIAVNAALTGHLLLSTFHANNASSAIPRLLDMQVEPFLLASTLDLIAAQRLIRKICEQCKYSVTVTPAQIAKYGLEVAAFFPKNEMTLYQAKGCEACNNTGFTGRAGIFEFIKITPKLQQLILSNPSAQQIWKLAKEQGSHSLFEDGAQKVMSGVTTLDELLRVAAPQSQV